MPVSKKRKKKDGKPVQRTASATPAEGAEHPHGPEEKVAPTLRSGKPSNPFVAQQQAKRGALRGR